MRRLFLAASALALLSVAACGRREASTDSPEAAAAPARQPADATPPPHRPLTQASAVISADGGAYGMPRAPIPYNALGAYERQRGPQAQQVPPGSVQPGQPGPPPGPPPTGTAKPRSPDTVFY